MDSHSSPSPPLPPLRFTRHNTNTPFEEDVISKSLPAGPSRIPHATNDGSENFDEEDDPDAQSTPKMPLSASIQSSRSSPDETPAARLRALLSRTPNNRPPVQERPPAPPSEVESDFDPPRFTPATPSIARESLKELLSRALREPGDTPRKERRRRNSIDISEVEASPRADRERAKNKGKRRSLSDEEAEGPSRSSQRSTNSTTSSRTAALVALREKVERSFANSKKMSPLLVGSNRYENDKSNESNDTATFLRDLNSSQATPPAAHSTPQRSLQLPSQLQSQSNLLEHDSEMHNAMRGLDSFEEDSETNRRTPFPPSQSQASAPSLSHVKSIVLEHADGKARGLGSLSRQGSSNSVDKNLYSDKDRSHSRAQHEMTGRPADSHHHQKLNHAARSRTRSSVSIESVESSSPSRTDSVVSRSDHHERAIDLDKERNVEREREWNKPHLTVPRPVSSLKLHPPAVHSRTISHPTRPEHMHSHLSPDLSHHRNHSFSSSEASSPDSITSHQAAKELESEILHEIEHKRVRNWNAPHPKWGIHIQHHDRPESPMTHSHSHSHSHTPARVRTESLTSLKSKGSNSNLNKSPELRRSPVKSPPPPPPPVQRQPGTLKSPGTHRPAGYPSRPRSPLPPMKKQNESSSRRNSPTPDSHSTWQFPSIKTTLPPFELDSDTQERPLSRNSPSPMLEFGSSSKSSRSALKSRIPVMTPKKPQADDTSTVDSQNRSHEEPEHSATHIAMVGRNTPAVNGDDFSPADNGSPDEDASGSAALPQISTPTVRQAEMPGPLPPISESPRLRAKDDEARLHRLASSSIAQEASPPLTPLEPPTSAPPAWSLLTPPRRSSFSTSRINFQSPSPPDDSPNLPEPPSTPDEEDENEQKREQQMGRQLMVDAQSNVTTFATPRPPGAWASMTVQAINENHSYSLPAEDKDFLHQNGLVTPVSSVSRAAGSMPLQTPAPPGGWMVTPNRKSILKVRFDVEGPESEVSVNENEPSAILPGALEESSSSKKGAGDTRSSPSKNDVVVPTPIHVKEPQEEVVMRVSTPVPRETSVSVSPRSPRKSPSIRVVDAFGREKVSGNETVKDKKDRANGSVSVDDTSRSKTTIRIVDAMGREVAPGQDESKFDVDGPLKRGEALSRVRKGLGDLASILDEEDRSIDESQLDKQLVSKLQAESRGARDIRAKLSQSLATVRKAEVDLKSRYTSFKTSLLRSNPLMHGWTLWTLITIQVVLAFIMYRISTARARVIFLTTYYDPFYPDLHLYIAKPYTYYYSISSSHMNPPRSISSILQHDGWLAALSGLWDYLLASASAWQTYAWEAWGVGGHGQKMSWPPT